MHLRLTPVCSVCNFKNSLNVFRFRIINIFFGPRENPLDIIVWFCSSGYNNTFTGMFRNFCINNFSFQSREIEGGTSWQTGTSANSIVKPNFTIFKANRSCVIFAHISKQPMSCKMILEYSGFGNNATYFPVEITTSLQRLCNVSNPHFSDVAK